MSQCQVDVFTRCGVDPAKLRLMRLGRRSLNTRPLPPKSARPATAGGGDGGGPLIVFGSNLDLIPKGRDVVEREFRLIADRGVPAELWLYGGDPKIENPLVRYRGPYASADLDGHCRTADVGLVPSVWYESYGYVGPEMLTRGLPVIASDVGAMKEYVHDGRNGLLFDPAVPGALADTVARLAADRTLLADLTAGAERSVGEFQSFDAHLDDVERFYAELLAPSPVVANGRGLG